MRIRTNKFIAIFFAATLLFGCEATKTANKKQKGAVIGASGGAIIGGVVGKTQGNTALGAIIGGVVGGAAGAYIGNKMDKQAQEIKEEIPGAEIERVGEGINVTFDEASGIYFATDKFDLNEKSRETLDKLASILKEYPKTDILIEGHTDSVGSESYNLTLSKNRAQAVTNYLTDKEISKDRLATAWFGESQPKFDNTTAEGRAKNRRVEVAIIANEEMLEEANQAVKQN